MLKIMMNDPQTWENAARYWSKKIPKIQNKERVTEGEINHIQNQIANINNTILSDKLQYDQTVGGNVYDSAAAQAYYVAKKRGKYNKGKLHKQEVLDDKEENTLNSALDTAEYYENYDNNKAQELRSEHEQRDSEIISIVLGVLGILAMFL